MRPGGAIAFVMPYAAMSRRQFEGFRRGIFVRQGKKGAPGPLTFVCFAEAWAFSDDVQPLFPVPACVLFAERLPAGANARVLPSSVLAASGALPRRDAAPEEADAALCWRQASWPA